LSFLSARLKAGLSQAAVAEHLGITAASVCQWETGKNLPRTALLRDIADLYGCTIDELLTPVDPEAPAS
jgi:transcriptional regulator with XRE-family HTH domain